MFRNTLYYGIKPLVPSTVRLAVRRWFALRKRAGVAKIWPIMPGSEQTPPGWAGWPQGKQFALVLTHDVEGQAGLDKCGRMMDLESRFGFRSSFNLIPEGGYRATPEVRGAITDRGFEVGVHDLYHNGKLYRSRREFARNAKRINIYLRQWNAAGFRSGFMLHRLEWLHQLDVLYDASTFDTDPFEPQPDHRNTIFPFWVPSSEPCRNRAGRGYVELPYTLPQDSTLFLLLGEQRPDIWLQKLDWLARHGGMALVNVHPDYVRFGSEPASRQTFPAELYARFLGYARDKYGDCFWQVTAAELARWFKGTVTPEPGEVLPPQDLGLAEVPIRIPDRPASKAVARPVVPRRICMVSHSIYDTDNRVMRYAEELARRGDSVEVLALKRDPRQASVETVRQVRVCRIQCRPQKNQKSRMAFLLPLLRFWMLSSLNVTWRHWRQPYDLVHVHNVPDFLVFAAWLPKLTGARVILDIHDILPEFYANKFRLEASSVSVRLLERIERASARFSDHVIISNDLWRDKFATRTGVNGKCSVFINNVDAAVFEPRARTRDDGKLILLFPGGLQWHQGLDIAIRAFRRVSAALPQAEFHIYGDGNMKESLVRLVEGLGLAGKVLFFDPLPVREIVKVMANADLGVVPKRADSFGNEAYSTKIMEFLSLGVPVVVSNTRIDRFYFDDSVVRFFESGNEHALAEAVLGLLQDAAARQQLIRNGRVYVSRNSWETRRQQYLDLVDSLTRTN